MTLYKIDDMFSRGTKISLRNEKTIGENEKNRFGLNGNLFQILEQKINNFFEFMCKLYTNHPSYKVMPKV